MMIHSQLSCLIQNDSLTFEKEFPIENIKKDNAECLRISQENRRRVALLIKLPVYTHGLTLPLPVVALAFDLEATE
jgi:hypothetical protein